MFYISSAFAKSTEASQVMQSKSLISDLLQASPIVQALLVALVMMSIFSWAIIYNKYLQLQDTQSADDKFEDKFWKTQTLQGLYDSLQDFPDSAMARVFKSAYLELQKIVEASQNMEATGPVHLFGYDNLERSIRKSIDIEIARLESRLGFLATTGSTGPFIGLLGTVLGIMTSFREISQTGSASLAVVAPGISEALFATAVGLFAAIPAVIAYNHFINRIKKSEVQLNSFGTDFLNVAKRNFFRES